MNFEDQKQSKTGIRQERRKNRQDMLPAVHEYSQAAASGTSDKK
jgi:hypothetical protein